MAHWTERLPSESSSPISRALCVFALLLGLAIPIVMTGQPVVPTDPGVYETVLIPLSVYIPLAPLEGANGSKWAVTLQVYNLLDEEVLLNQFRPFCQISCPTDSGYAGLPAEFLGSLETGAGSAGIEVALLHVERIHSSLVRFQLRLSDASRTDENLGTEIPVVRESDFVSGRSALLDIPVSGEARVALRLYDLSGATDGETFRVIVYSNRGREALLEQNVTLATIGPPQYPGFPPYPGYAEIFSIEQRPELAGYEKVRIEIEPIDPDAKYWVMASVTNNTTQMVTIVSPQ